MTYDVQRWAPMGWGMGVATDHDGLYVLAADAEAHEKAAVEAAEQRGREHQFSAARDEVDGDGTVRIVYGDDCPQVLVSRELLDSIVADFNNRRDWFTPAENRVTREQAIRDCIAAVEHLHDYEAPHDAHRDALWNAITALRALLEGDKK
jgi:hypothetical protein